MKLEITHRDPFHSIKISVNDAIVLEEQNINSVSIVCDSLPATISVEFSPFKIKPIVRIDNFMVNYWLANIQEQEHKLEFNLDDNFFLNYKKKDIESRLNYLTSEQQKIPEFQDKYVGVNNLHPDLVNKIKSLIQ